MHFIMTSCRGCLWKETGCFLRKEVNRSEWRQKMNAKRKHSQPAAVDRSDKDFHYGSIVTATVTRRFPPPWCHHFTLRPGAHFYTDVGKISHEAITRLSECSVAKIVSDNLACRVMFRKTRRQDYFDHHLGVKDSKSRRCVHPHDLETLCTVMGIKSGDRVMDVGTGYGSTTLLLSDIVGPSGHVISTDRIQDDTVERVIESWVTRGSSDQEKRYSNVTVHNFDVKDLSRARREIDEALHRSSSYEVVFKTPNLVGSENVGGASDLPLDAATLIKLPMTGIELVLRNLETLLKTGASIGFIPLHFDDISSLNDLIHEHRLPFIMECLRSPADFRVYGQLDLVQADQSRAEGDVEEIERGTESLTSPESVDATDEDEFWLDRNSWRKNMDGYPKAFNKRITWPRKPMLWTQRKRNPSWLVNLLKVGDYEFVYEAEKESYFLLKEKSELERRRLEEELSRMKIGMFGFVQ